MSTVPPLSGPPLYRYIPGVGKVGACISGPTGPPGVTLTSTYISAYSTVDQTLSASPTGISHQGVFGSNGITLTPPSTQFNIATTGTYKVLYSMQYLGTSGNGTIAVFFKKNGNNIADSSTYTKYNNNDEGLITAEFIFDLTAGDTLEVFGATTGGGTASIDYIAAVGSTIPAAPGIVTNIYRIA